MKNTAIESLGDISSLVELLRYRALQQPEKRAYTFLTNGESERGSITYAELERRARAVGAFLQSLELKGERALLLYPAGLDYIIAFLGCLYAGVAAVPAYPPRLNRNLLRLQNIVNDSKAQAVLTTAAIIAKFEPLIEQTPGLSELQWLMTDSINTALAYRWQDPAATGDTLAFLQYTSGSVGLPKGVMVSHGNVLNNEKVINTAFELREDTVIVGWLPIYHDMGLMGNVLQTLYTGGSHIFMSPVDFLQKPYRWLKAISDYKGVFCGGPNFAYDLCVNKITEEQKATLDLRSWRAAFNGAEPVRYETIERFTAAFEPVGFSRTAMYPCYGMAETTLMVSGGGVNEPPAAGKFSAPSLEKNEIAACSEAEPGRILVSCGHAWLNHKLVIADPELLVRCAPDKVGEIWVSGASVAGGYWNKPETTRRTFHAYLSDSGAGPFLRTGDLGFIHDGELFVTGRLKDLIIIRGTNHYPQDIELTVEQCHEAIRPGCCAAFSLDIDGEERLGIVAEIERRFRPRENQGEDGQNEVLTEIYSAIQESIFTQHELQIHQILLLKPGSIPKTSSGKIQRHACRAGLLDGTLSAERGVMNG
ncbi:amp-dependent synthetase/ligase [Lucifera butyrica]|uniref:Amp-dependent synthetase/ligase n=1 Tax=Lucifera butyrica TaxID=1351585 RepID=A0A498R1A7_9FIRM|nr:fatty acyl-AMP ligase [Lucifera butyrica]VBB05121.1 amp-dependent synthetase/ligase [Lucifera butyrica]